MQNIEQIQEIMSKQTPININIEQGDTLIDLAFFIFKVSFIIMIFYFLVIKRKKRDLRKAFFKQAEIIPQQKIIVALEIKDFFISISNRPDQGYEQIIVNDQSNKFMWKVLSNVLGYRIFFKPLFSLKQIENFVKNMKKIKEIELMIYTQLNPDLTDLIIKKLKLESYFPLTHRRYCDPKQSDMMKHAIDIDKNSRRVIIITPNKKDHYWQDDQYFLNLNPKRYRSNHLLREYHRVLKNLLENNQDKDILHEQLGQLKIDVQQSDYSDYSDVERQMA